MSTAGALRALVVQYIRPGLLIAKITEEWQAPLCPPRRHGRRKAKSKTDSTIPTSTSVGRLATTIVGGGSRLGRKNRAKAGKTNGTSDDGENDGASML
jgi:hypothetical protein